MNETNVMTVARPSLARHILPGFLVLSLVATLCYLSCHGVKRSPDRDLCMENALPGITVEQLCKKWGNPSTRDAINPNGGNLEWSDGRVALFDERGIIVSLDEGRVCHSDGSIAFSVGSSRDTVLYQLGMPTSPKTHSRNLRYRIASGHELNVLIVDEVVAGVGICDVEALDRLAAKIPPYLREPEQQAEPGARPRPNSSPARSQAR